MKDIAVFGAGGLGREVACILEKLNEAGDDWNFLGFFDDGFNKGDLVDGHVILGGLEDLNEWSKPISVSFGIGSPTVVKKIVARINNPLIDFPNIIAPDVFFMKRETVKMGKGNFINLKSIISINVTIGDFNTVGGGCSLGHDSKLGDYNTMMPSVQVCGYVEVDTLNFLGINAVVMQGNKVGKNVTVGAGSILMKDAIDDATYFGNPARPMIKK